MRVASKGAFVRVRQTEQKGDYYSIVTLYGTHKWDVIKHRLIREYNEGTIPISVFVLSLFNKQGKQNQIR